MFIENLDQKRCISVKSLEFISAGIDLSNIFLDPFQWTHARRSPVRTMATVCSWKEPKTVTAVSAIVQGTMVLAVIRVSITEAANRWGDLR